MTEGEEKKKNANIIVGVVGLVVLALVAILVWMLSSGEETYIANNAKNSKINSLECVAEVPKEAFFVTPGANMAKHTIRATFKDDKADDVSYMFYGNYNSEEVAKSIEAKLHGEYNKYMGEHGISQQSLSATFVSLGNDVKISLYVKRNKLDNTTIKFFFLDMNEFQRLGSYSAETLGEIYQNKGFSCTFSE